MPQRDTFLIMGLRRKRARLAGEIEATERKIAPLRQALAQVDALLRLFEPGGNPELIPAIRPTPRCMFFRHGEQIRLCLDALRQAGRPLRALAVAEYALAAKGIETDDKAIRTMFVKSVQVALVRLEKRGVARRLICTPETWWELVD